MLSELTANALQHAGCVERVELCLTGSALRVVVRDPLPDPPVPVVADIDTDHGRGLLLVQQLAARWGVRRQPDNGKDVWLELAV